MTRIPPDKMGGGGRHDRCPTCASPCYWNERMKGYICPRCDAQEDGDPAFRQWRHHQLGLLAPDPVSISLPAVPSVRVDTSEAAAESMDEHQSRLARDILALIRRTPGGLTCDRIEQLLDLRHQTASARIRELALADWIEDSGERAINRSGRKGILWVPRGMAAVVAPQ